MNATDRAEERRTAKARAIARKFGLRSQRQLITGGSVTINSPGYAGARVDRMNPTAPGCWSADSEIRNSLYTLRGRCRLLERENDYARKFLQECEINVIGSGGMVLQMKVKEERDRIIYDADEKSYLVEVERKRNERRQEIEKKLRAHGYDVAVPPLRILHAEGERAKVIAGSPDYFANMMIEGAWKLWKRPANCSVTRTLDFHTVEKLNVRTTVRDGEIFIRKVKGFDNPFGFALQLIDPDWIDTSFNTVLGNGNEVRMGIEFNQWKQPVAYWVTVRRPGDWQRGSIANLGGIPSAGGTGGRERIDASEIIHPFVMERIDQSRGVPWMVSAITRLQMLGAYEEAEVIQARIAASKGGTYEWEGTGDPDVDRDFGPDEDGEFVEEVAPGQISIAPPGWKLRTHELQHPNANYPEFRKGVLRGISAGIGTSYNILASDLEGVNYSSLRGGLLDEREGWMLAQAFEERAFYQPIFEAWLESALMSGQVKLPVSKFDKFNAPMWQGRRWKWVDPLKDITAAILAVENGFTSRGRIIGEQGNDLEEIFDELATEELIANDYGLVFGAGKDAQEIAKAGATSSAQESGQADSEKATVALIARVLKRAGIKVPANLLTDEQ